MFIVITLTFGQRCKEESSNGSHGIVNSDDHDQTAPLGTVLSRPALLELAY